MSRRPSEMSPEQRNDDDPRHGERLAERLKQDGSDVEGWLRLVRAYMVLGDTDKARAAAGDARRALASDPTSSAGSTSWSKSWGSKAEIDDAQAAAPGSDRLAASACWRSRPCWC